jgi:hypothetical protein
LCADQGFKQVSGLDLKGKMVQIRARAAGKFTGTLQIMQTRLTQSKILQRHRQTEFLKQRQQLAARLSS